MVNPTERETEQARIIRRMQENAQNLLNILQDLKGKSDKHPVAISSARTCLKDINQDIGYLNTGNNNIRDFDAYELWMEFVAKFNNADGSWTNSYPILQNFVERLKQLPRKSSS